MTFGELQRGDDFAWPGDPYGDVWTKTGPHTARSGTATQSLIEPTACVENMEPPHAEWTPGVEIEGVTPTGFNTAILDCGDGTVQSLMPGDVIWFNDDGTRRIERSVSR